MPVPDTFVDLAKHSASRFDERRKYEWQLGLAFWGLIVLAIHFKKNIPYLSADHPALLLFTFVLFLFVWLRGVWVANDNDKRLSCYFVDLALIDLGHGTEPSPSWPDKHDFKSLKYWFGFLLDWSGLFQTFVTGILLYVFYRA